LKSLTKSYRDINENVFNQALELEEKNRDEILSRKGPENIHLLHDELANWMVNNVTVKRNNKDLAATLDAIRSIRERSKNITLDDKSRFANQTYIFAKQFEPMLDLAEVITLGALKRDEFRGAHFKPEFPQRDDEHWLKKTMASFNPKTKEVEISYAPVDTRHLKPIQRDYSQAKKVKPHLENIPSNITLPI
jgi:succinate dehydrogenase / fumarate reductase flavoprotein subunit